ncbi:SRPBCC family protein [Jatrophihabitans sp. DSM 45814]
MTSIESSAAAERTGTDYQRTVLVKALPGALFDALTTTAGLTAWWTQATGAGEAGGELKFFFEPPEPLVVNVDKATRPTSVQWTVKQCDFLSDWVGTRPSFTITAVGGGAAELQFRHYGLTSELDCIQDCSRGWDHFLESLREYVEVGHGMPRGSDADKARRL